MVKWLFDVDCGVGHREFGQLDRSGRIVAWQEQDHGAEGNVLALSQ